MPSKRSSRLSLLVFRAAPFLFWMSAIFAFSSLSGSSVPFEPPAWYIFERKGAHVFEYAVLMFLSVRFAFAWFPKESLKRIVFLAGAFSLAYAASDELHQFFVPYRGAKITDVLIDGGGILLVAAVLFIFGHYRKEQ